MFSAVCCFSLLIYVEPIACTVIFFVALLDGGLTSLPARVAEWGNERQKHEAKIQYLQEGFDGIKMIKLLEIHPNYKKFKFHTDCGQWWVKISMQCNKCLDYYWNFYPSLHFRYYI